MGAAGVAGQALPETRGVTPGRESASRPGGLTVDARGLPGMIAREPRTLLTERNVNELPAGGQVLTPDERPALPPAPPEPEAPIRTQSGQILQGGTGRIAARRELLTPRGMQIDAEIGQLEDRLWRAPNKGAASQIQARIRELQDERLDLIERGRPKR